MVVLDIFLDLDLLLGTENASDGRYPPVSRNCGAAVSEASPLRKKSILSNRSTPPDSSYATTARKRSPLKTSDNNKSPTVFQKLDRKKPANWEVEITVPNAPSVNGVFEDAHKDGDENVPERRNNEKPKFSKPETKRTLFYKSSDDKGHKFGGCRSGSRVAPCHEENRQSTVVVSNVTEDIHKNHKECEDLSLIRNQLVQIEKQQTSLLDLLQVCFSNLNFGFPLSFCTILNLFGSMQNFFFFPSYY